MIHEDTPCALGCWILFSLLSCILFLVPHHGRRRSGFYIFNACRMKTRLDGMASGRSWGLFSAHLHTPTSTVPSTVPGMCIRYLG